MLLAVSLSTLAVPIVAQSTGAAKAPNGGQTTLRQSKGPRPVGTKHGVPSRKLASGEAARLARNEGDANAEERDLRDESRGHLASAKHVPKQKTQVSKASHPSRNTAAPKMTSVNQHRATPQLKTGQLTTNHAAHLTTKKVSLHPSAHSKSTHGSRTSTTKDGAQDSQQQDKSSPEIHLKQHNARMF